MQPFHRPLFLLTECEELVACLRQVMERPFSLYRVADWTSLKRELRSAAPTAVCFVDAMRYVGCERALAEGLRELTQEFPNLAVVGCLEIGSGDVGVLAALQSWGVAEILDLRRDVSSAAVARRLDAVANFWTKRLFQAALPRSFSARGRAVVGAVARITAQGGNVPELAKALGIKNRSVSRWCSDAGLPEPRRMFAWVKLLLAAELLDDHHRTFESVARATGFSSAASLKSTAKVFTGLNPTELRGRGAFNVVSGLARAEFRAAREAARQSRRQRNTWYN